MSGIRYNGTQFELTVDEFNGALMQNGLETSAAEQTRVPSSVLLLASNALLDLNGIARKRGGLCDGATGRTNLLTSGASVMVAAPRSHYGAGSVGPYLHWVVPAAGTQATAYVQASSGSAVSSVVGGALPTTYVPFVDPGFFVVTGTDNKYTTSGKRTMCGTTRLIGVGSDGNSYSTGSVTMAADSPNVVGSGTTWTSAMQGKFLDVNGSEGAGYIRPYLIKEVLDATNLVLAEPYRGTNTGAGKTYAIVDYFNLEWGRRSDYPWGSSTSSQPIARFAFEAWNRLVVAHIQESRNASEAPSNAASRAHPTRIRWSGIIGSEEGYDPNGTVGATNNRAIVGIHAWHKNGYLDFPGRFGELVAGCQFRDSVVVWQESGMTVLFGQPTFDTAGSLDATTVYEDIRINEGWAYTITPYGIFFVDKRKGPMVYNGGGPPKPLPIGTGLREAVKACKHVGYFDDHVVFNYETAASHPAGATTLSMPLYHIPTQRWSSIDSATITSSITHFQRSVDHECCFLAVGNHLGGSAQGSIGAMDYITRPPGAGGLMGDFPNVGSATPGIDVNMSIASRAFGAQGVKHRVEGLWATHTGILRVYAYHDSLGNVSAGPRDLAAPGANEIATTNGGEVTNGQQAAAIVLYATDYGLTDQGTCEVTQIIAKGQAEGWTATDYE